MRNAPRAVFGFHSCCAHFISRCSIANRACASDSCGLTIHADSANFARCIVVRCWVVTRSARAFGPLSRVCIVDITLLTRSACSSCRVVCSRSCCAPRVSSPRVISRARPRHRADIAPMLIDISSGCGPSTWSPCCIAIWSICRRIWAPIWIRVVVIRIAHCHSHSVSHAPTHPRVVRRIDGISVSHRRWNPHIVVVVRVVQISGPIHNHAIFFIRTVIARCVSHQYIITLSAIDTNESDVVVRTRCWNRIDRGRNKCSDSPRSRNSSRSKPNAIFQRIPLCCSDHKNRRRAILDNLQSRPRNCRHHWLATDNCWSSKLLRLWNACHLRDRICNRCLLRLCSSWN